MVLITGRQLIAKSPFRIDTIQIVRRLVALTVFILELIAELQECSLGNRFAVSDLCTIIIVIGGGSDELVTDQHRIRVSRNLIITCHRFRILVIVIIPIAKASAECDIAPLVVQFPVDLQRCIRRNTFAVIRDSNNAVPIITFFMRLFFMKQNVCFYTVPFDRLNPKKFNEA